MTRTGVGDLFHIGSYRFNEANQADPDMKKIPDPLDAPRAAYVHVPFCRHHCGYCNFTVVAGRDDLISAYLMAIQRELQTLGEPHPVTTLYLGGGTPTHLSPVQLDDLLTIIAQWLPRREGAPWEFTVEANPEDLDAPRAAILARHGVTRVSLGVQSFDAAKRAALERAHTEDHVDAAIHHTRAIRADLAIDLIFAAPSENVSDWLRDLDRAIDLAPDHVSTYGLTYEKGTAFWSHRLHGTLAEVVEDVQRDMYLAAIHRLTSAGFEHYEVSNFARPGHRSQHNQVYWRGESYFGFGPGAARYINGRRETNHRSTTTWLHRIEQGLSPTAESETLDPLSKARERLILGLRMIEGIDMAAFARETGFSVPQLAGAEIERFCDWELLEIVDDRLRLTRHGLLVSDSLWPELL